VCVLHLSESLFGIFNLFIFAYSQFAVAVLQVNLSLSLSHTRTHTHTHTSSIRLFDICQETSYRRIADEQTLLKIRLPDVNITSNRLVLSG